MLGVIDAIAEGCFAVARRPWTLLPLVLLDALYWLGARLSADPLLDGPIALFQWAQRQQETADPTNPLNPSPAQVAEQIATLRDAGQQIDLLWLLSIGQNPLLSQLGDDQIGRPWGVGVVDLGSGWLTLLAALGLILVGVLWFALTLAVVGVMVRDESPLPTVLVRRAVRYWGVLLILGVLLVATLLFLGVPLLFLSGLLQLLGLSPGTPLLLMIVPLLLAWLYLARTTDAIAVRDAGPFAAIKLSVRVVRRNFVLMLRLFAAGWLISAGFPLLWAYLARQTAGVPLAVVGNAFLNTGLLAAAMILFRDRLVALENPTPATVPPPNRPPHLDRRDRP